MRELKFRVWDKNDKTMHMVSHINFSEAGFVPERITSHIPNGQYNLSGKINGGKEDAFVLEQFTGLKDKKGKEVYEGDIVKLDDSWDELGLMAGAVTYVIFTSGGFRLSPTISAHPNSIGCWMDDDAASLLRVIGNIHENPELLEDEK
ncbi:MAG: YopX family protein [Candidatus Saccharimonadales bacterium]